MWQLLTSDNLNSFASAISRRQRTVDIGCFTEIAMYTHQASRGVGIQISRDRGDVVIDWAHIDRSWVKNAELDALFATSIPFSPAKDQNVDTFLFRVP